MFGWKRLARRIIDLIKGQNDHEVDIQADAVRTKQTSDNAT
jgi:hypothetical protein